jgi:Trpc4-associated protein
LGGIDLLLRLFNKPFSEPDARQMTPTIFQRRSELWNEVLVILREVAIAIPTISEKIFENSDIVFLFSLLHHQAMFDNTMNLLEEILASRDETFCLLLVPNFFSLVDSFSSRQLAHFCRVLSLVLFEPEDRQIMEGSQVLKSIDLLQLRRNRMAKNSSGIVERNQSLVIMCVIIFLAYCLLTLECTGN